MGLTRFTSAEIRRGTAMARGKGHTEPKTLNLPGMLFMSDKTDEGDRDKQAQDCLRQPSRGGRRHKRTHETSTSLDLLA